MRQKINRSSTTISSTTARKFGTLVFDVINKPTYYFLCEIIN